MSDIWFTSDWHLSHTNIIRYCDRPFDNTQHMNEQLVERHNRLVAPDDDVYVLGDVAMGRRTESLPWISRFNGQLHLISGNHDPCWAHRYKPSQANKLQRARQQYMDAGFATIADTHQLNLGGTHVLLHHFPYAGDSKAKDRYVDARPQDRGAWLLHGHVHELWRQNGRQINVGTDAWNYQPVHTEQILDLIDAGPQQLDRLPPT